MEEINQNKRGSKTRYILLIALIFIMLVFARGIYSLETKTTAEFVPNAYADAPSYPTPGFEGDGSDADCEGDSDCD